MIPGLWNKCRTFARTNGELISNIGSFINDELPNINITYWICNLLVFSNIARIPFFRSASTWRVVTVIATIIKFTVVNDIL